MFTLGAIKQHLIGMGHGSTLKKVRNINPLFERVASTFLLKVHPLESIRSAPLSSTVYDDIYNYALASDFGSLIDLAPQADRTSWDRAYRNKAGQFDREKAIKEKTISIEGSDGTKIIRINWRSRQGKVLNALDSLTANGTWAVVATASNLAADTIVKYSGTSSIRFDSAVSGDGIKNTSMTQVDLTDENGIADMFFEVYIKSAAEVALLTSITAIWGNDLTANYWTGVAQTAQADGTAFKVGWNIIKVPWSTATQTGTVNPATIDSFQVTLATTGAISKIRVDNIIFNIGRAFDSKYYSKYLYKSSASGTWISQPTSDEDYVMIDNDTLPMYLHECLIAMAQQMEGTESAFDISFAEKQLMTLFPRYQGLYPSMVKKAVGKYGGLPRLRR